MTDKRIALIFGASGTIGQAAAVSLADRKYLVARHWHERPLPDDARFDGQPELRSDLTDLEALIESVTILEERVGTPFLVVNCAGVRTEGLLLVQPPEQWTSTLHENVLVAYNIARAVLPGMYRAQQGGLVNVVSVAAQMGSPGQSAYAASKSAIVGLTRSLAREYGRRGLTINAVAPGFVDSPMTSNVRPKMRLNLIGRQAIPEVVTPEDVAEAICLLAEMRAVTGHVLVVDKGMSL